LSLLHAHITYGGKGVLANQSIRPFGGAEILVRGENRESLLAIRKEPHYTL